MSAAKAGSRKDPLSEALARLRVVSGPDEQGEYVCWCPFHSDGRGKPPHQPNLQVSERGFYCHACGAGGSLKRLVEQLGADTLPNGAHPEVTYDYCSGTGEILYQVCRYPGKRFAHRRPDGNGGWIWNRKGVKPVLYRLPDLEDAPAATVYIVEGEKDADRLAAEGLTATTNSGGASKWRKEHASELRDRDVVILRDNDPAGWKHANQVANSLFASARTVKVIELPGLPDKGDIFDWLSGGRTVDELEMLVERAPVWTPPVDDPNGRVQTDDEVGTGSSQADRLVALLDAEHVSLFHDDLNDTFAHVPVSDHREIWRCRSKSFRQWLAGRFWQVEKKAIGSEVLGSALNVIESKARFDGKEHPLHNRVAWHDGAIWYDLADKTWRAVRITAEGWRVVADPPALFRRYSHQRSQAEPVAGGDLRELLRFVNLSDPSQKLLLLVYVVCCLVPDIPHPIPVLHGPQGSAKTTMFRMLRRLVDPSRVEVLSFPHSATELVQQLSHHWAPYYDNVSTLPIAVSDILCRAVTGEGFSKRELYTDDDDVIYRFQRCVGLNGVNVVAHKPDLLDRCILFGLEPINPVNRRPEKEIWIEFETARPHLVGSILDALSRAMELRPSINDSELPRMADFALWGCAIASAIGYSSEEFLAAYSCNAEARNEEALEASPVAAMVVELMRERVEWEGIATELLSDLESLAAMHRVNTRAKGWPRGPQVLTRRLNEVLTNLTLVGIQVSRPRESSRRLIVIQKTPADSVTGVTSDKGAQETHDPAGVLGDAAGEPLKGPSPSALPGELPLSKADSGSDAGDADDASLGLS